MRDGFRSTMVCLGLALMASACCGGGRSHDSGSPGNKSASQAKAAPRAVIAAPNQASGAPQRGIVRDAPDFKAGEVTRLDNGTAIAVDAQLAGGWLQIHWPYPDGTSTGYIHHDVVKQ